VRRSHDEQFDAFMTASWASLYRTAVLLTGDTHLAEDLLQITMGKVYKSWPRVSRVEHPRSYARAILAHEAASWRRKKSSSELPTEIRADSATSPGHDDRVVQADWIWRALQQLTPRQRAVVVLRYYEDLTGAEIASALGISEGSVKAHAHHALRALEGTLTTDAGTSAGSAT
jgi:RNA polymerase sigma-70 factor (sigma-E family)